MKITSKVGFFFIILILFLIGLWWFLSNDNVQSSTSSQIIIVKKYAEDNQYLIQGYDPNSEQKKEIKIIVPDRNIWTLLNENQTYTMTYNSMKNNKYPVFVEIVSQSP